MDAATAFAGKKILITGAGGFVGGHLANWLARIPCTLALAGRGAPRPADPADVAAISWHAKDTTTAEFRETMVAGNFDTIFHFAGNTSVPLSVAQPTMDFQQNCVATVEILEALRTSGSDAVFVYASSAAVYGNPARLPIAEADPTTPISPYGVSKLAAESYVSAYCRHYGLRGSSLRIFNPFGPGFRKLVVYDLARKALRGPELEVIGDGSQARDFLYIDDLVSAILHVAAFAPHDGGAYNLGSGIATATSEIAEQLVEIVNPDLPIRYNEARTAGSPEQWCADIGKLRALGWAPKVSLAEGLARTAQWIMHEDS